VVKTFDTFGADFIQIQGDGAFALFWGDRRYERAMCAGITIRTASADLVERLENKWPDIAETGFKVGVASGRVLVKRIGTPATQHSRNRSGPASPSTTRPRRRSQPTGTT
jgi:class 3 adenylate cyclase